MTGHQTILYAEDGPVGTLTLNRPQDGNMFTPDMCHEIRDCNNAVRRETRTRGLVMVCHSSDIDVLPGIEAF